MKIRYIFAALLLIANLNNRLVKADGLIAQVQADGTIILTCSGHDCAEMRAQHKQAQERRFWLQAALMEKAGLQWYAVRQPRPIGPPHELPFPQAYISTRIGNVFFDCEFAEGRYSMTCKATNDLHPSEVQYIQADLPPLARVLRICVPGTYNREFCRDEIHVALEK